MRIITDYLLSKPANTLEIHGTQLQWKVYSDPVNQIRQKKYSLTHILNTKTEVWLTTASTNATIDYLFFKSR
jgi:hypothetical protein